MITVANPIYDSVFKFLMQDTKVSELVGDNKNNFLKRYYANKDLKRGEQLIQIEDLDDLEDYKIIARRLALAAVDKEVRKRMNMEDDAKHELDLWKEEYEMRIKNAEARIEKSKEEGRTEEKIAIAKSLKASGIPMEVIKQSTGLSEDEINGL